jgi:aminoglycoside phosphotransferase (APT) family kinase protein
VYAWEAGWVLKLFFSWVSAGDAEREAFISRTVHATGYPAPAVGEVVVVDGRHGIIFERIEGPSILRLALARPWLFFSGIRQLADLHVAMHARTTPDLPPQRERLASKIQRAHGLSPELIDGSLAALQKLPQDNRLCHGDFHPDNILVTSRGPVVIDWLDATRGHPLGDVARTCILLSVGQPPNRAIGLILDTLRSALRSAYLRRYYRLSGFNPDDLAPWIPVTAAARLEENILGEGEALVRMVERGLAR